MASFAGRRKDAIANEARIVEAAAAIFAERGLDAPVPAIAARAGVGKGTVYRNFPTKADLVAAIALDRMATFSRLVEDASAAEDAWDAFCDFLTSLLVLQSGDRGLGDALRHEQRADVLEARRSVIAGIDALLARARAQGMARSDASAADMRVFVSGVAGELTTSGVTDLDEWRRYAKLVADVFRTPQP